MSPQITETVFLCYGVLLLAGLLLASRRYGPEIKPGHKPRSVKNAISNQ